MSKSIQHFLKTNEIRQAFLDYFEAQDHVLVSSSPLVPGNDPTLLFTNAGMVQFKEVFLGLEQRLYTRAASSQCCVRAGGKHNDLENVGYTARHHTFFEMLGNFSFGDYFKREAIQYAWDFLTKVLKLPADKLWVTVYLDDDEAADIWLKELKVDPKRFTRCGEKDNFWSMGETGPCGPCSEIFYDHGPSIAGGPPGTVEQEGDRYVEIWNLVFMQYDRSQSGELTQLPKPSVDTGMGLERLAAVLQGVHSNYDIDIFRNLIASIATLTQTKDHGEPSLKVIADHIRSCAFLICDGVIPANEGRGYVLRRIIRRAIRHGNKLGMHEPFFYQLVQPLLKEMGEAYPQLIKSHAIIEKVLLQEEEQFEKTLEQGLKILEQDLAQLKNKMIPGTTIFKLYDTYGFPVDLTGDIARERDFTLDMEGFELAMAEQRRQSQAASQFSGYLAETVDIQADTDFVGYEHLQYPTKVTHILVDAKPVEMVATNQTAAIILESTPFYAEGGGQVGDTGILKSNHTKFIVEDTQKHGSAFLHYGHVSEGQLKVSETIDAQVNVAKRRATMLNHTATHLLHAALRQILGEHVLQKGSLVDPERLRFDFTHYESITREQLRQVEDLVNEKIRENIKAETHLMTPDKAKASGAMALFGEKYGDKVRVLEMGEFSKELCGGTHVKRTGDIGYFKVISESSVAAGVRRIEAITGPAAAKYASGLEDELHLIADELKTNRVHVVDKVKQLLQKSRELEKESMQLRARLATSASAGPQQDAAPEEINGTKLLIRTLTADIKTLRQVFDTHKSKLGTGIVVLIGEQDDRINVVAGISKDLIGKVPAPAEFVKTLCGKGGGRDDMAQGGGAKPTDLDKRLAIIRDMLKKEK